MRDMKHAASFHRALRMAGAALGVVVAVGCAPEVIATESPLANAHVSPEALAEAALAAVAAQDDSTLAALMIERDEYETLLWPEMPDGEYTPFEFIWSQTLPQSRAARRAIQREYEGIDLELVSVDLGADDDIERYPSFTLYREARMTVRRRDNGAEGVLPLMDALVEMGGGWKFMNYRDDS